MLQFNQVKKYYGHYLAMDITSLTLQNGIYWLKGENGTGKTTFLKMIGGLHPFEGDILTDKYSIKKNRTQFLQSINYAEAEPLYPDFLTAKDLVELYCYTKKGDQKLALDLLGELHLRDVYEKPLGTFSSGMLKKLSLVLAFIGDPAWVLLDEPLITVDVEAVNIMGNLIDHLYKQKNTSFLITSHQPFQTDSPHIMIKLIAENKTVSLLHE
jgi:ABC-2 type transport system ATP-binding protein